MKDRTSEGKFVDPKKNQLGRTKQVGFSIHQEILEFFVEKGYGNIENSNSLAKNVLYRIFEEERSGLKYKDEKKTLTEVIRSQLSELFITGDKDLFEFQVSELWTFDDLFELMDSKHAQNCGIFIFLVKTDAIPKRFRSWFNNSSSGNYTVLTTFAKREARQIIVSDVILKPFGESNHYLKVRNANQSKGIFLPISSVLQWARIKEWLDPKFIAKVTLSEWWAGDKKEREIDPDTYINSYSTKTKIPVLSFLEYLFYDSPNWRSSTHPFTFLTVEENVAQRWWELLVYTPEPVSLIYDPSSFVQPGQVVMKLTMSNGESDIIIKERES